MPYAAPRLCSRHGPHTGRCKPCEQTRQKQADTKTGEERTFYGSARWKRVRLAQLRREPLCRTCKEDGRLKPARVADHIVPRRQGGADEPSNLQSQCWSCHQRKRQQERTT